MAAPWPVNPRTTEIRNTDFARGVHQDLGRLQVCMDHAFSMEISATMQNLSNDPWRVSWAKFRAHVQRTEIFSAMLENKARRSARIRIEQPQDIGMHQVLSQANLAKDEAGVLPRMDLGRAFLFNMTITRKTFSETYQKTLE
jgi:hypothetical protein